MANFCNSFVSDFENLHNLIHHKYYIWWFQYDPENSKSCETTLSSNVLGNETETFDSQLKVKFVSKNIIDLFKQNLAENKISFLSKVLYFIPTCNEVGVAVAVNVATWCNHSKYEKKIIIIKNFKN